MIKFNVHNRWSGSVQFTAEIDCAADTAMSVKLGLAVKWAVSAKVSLIGANLSGVNLIGANLSGADLSGVNLSGANLIGANLIDANLRDANLIDANLIGANLRGANLIDANLSGAKNADLAIAKTRILPEGALIGWKKLKNNVIAKLEIPAEAKRSHAFGRKCRAEYVKCLEVIGASEGISMHDDKTIYRAGEIIKPHQFDDNWQEECAGGIHFYITRLEAEAHN